jgi:hypothetical protein
MEDAPLGIIVVPSQNLNDARKRGEPHRKQLPKVLHRHKTPQAQNAVVHVLDRGVHIDVPHDDQPESVKGGDLRQSVGTLHSPLQHNALMSIQQNKTKRQRKAKKAKQNTHTHTPA